MIGIVDYRMGNLGSVRNALDFLGLPAQVLDTPARLADCRAVILPGVGAFGDAMQHLRAQGWEPALRAWVTAGRPFLGLCLGLQVLFESSEEAPGVPGFGWLPGRIRRFPSAPGLKVPQMGWNRVTWTRPHPLLDGVPDGYFYFVHSYYADGVPEDMVAGRTKYGLTYPSAVGRGALFATQCHPEKSQRLGLKLLENFGRWIGRPSGTPA